MDAFFHVCKNVDVARANQLAAISLMCRQPNGTTASTDATCLGAFTLIDLFCLSLNCLDDVVCKIKFVTNNFVVFFVKMRIPESWQPNCAGSSKVRMTVVL